ncbi:hypothetical protein JZ751_020312 [Albula glossodonta]|uniref:Fatty acid hydroxylase domain-containing protein n=1 Tax=Albula glossodonta TaxID=121402 RepID=A0A8T2NSX6_9TELE|nr:hypothetical protein JZ751_020312 [Albula glossodonta]
MWNISNGPMSITLARHSDRVLQPLWDHARLRHHGLVSSPFFPALLVFFTYISFSFPFAVLDLLGERAPAFHRYKIQKARRVTWRMMADSIRRAVYNNIVFVVPVVLLGNWVMPAPPLPVLAPTVWEVLVGGLAMLLVFDTQYFVWHVAHHKNRHLYRWGHAIHHEYIAPFSWASQHLSILELLALGLWSNQDPVLLHCHPLTNWAFIVLSVVLSVEDHIGYDLPWSLHHLVPLGLFGGAAAHDMHHQKPNTNYAPFFSHWDRIFGTAARDEDQLVEALPWKETSG